MMDVTICPMEISHVEAVQELEKACFSVPWTKKMLLEGLSSPYDKYLIAQNEEGVVGYSCLRLLVGEGEIMRIAVFPSKRRMGLGRKLMDAMVEIAREGEAEILLLEVRAGNAPAINLYKSYGFKEDGVRKGYYVKPAEDALLMSLRGITCNSQ